MLLACLALLILASLVGPAYAAAETISTDTTWTKANSPYIRSGDVVVNAGVTLTIEPGVVVKFDGVNRSLNVYGHLEAIGTSSERIVFTSLADTGLAGQWQRIYVSGQNASANLRYADVRYAGSECCAPSRTYGALTSYGADVTAHETTFTNNNHSAIYISRGNSTGWPKATVTNSLIADNGLGISTLNASAEIRASLIQANTEEGLYAGTSSTYTGPATVVYDSDISANGKHGVNLSLISSATPAASWPKGSRNNIYDNDQPSTPPYQLRATKNIPATVDWTGNFWGDDVRYAANAGGCAPAGRLEHEDSTAPPPKPGPFWRRSVLTYVNGQWITCLQDYPALGPTDFEPEYIKHPLPAAWEEMIKSAIVQRAPIFLYDSGESFHIVSPGAMTDLPGADSADPDLSNSLKDAGGNIFAIANADLAEVGWGYLNLDYLRPTYPTGAGPRAGTAAADTDFVDPRGDDAQQVYDSFYMETLPAYGNKVYGRFVYGSDGMLWLQYWVFLYRNPDPSGVWPEGTHEGDWEMVQISLTPALTPDLVNYSQHNTGETCTWGMTQTAGLAPLVYVAEHSHASYFAPDQIPLIYEYDHADGQGGGTYSDNLELINTTNPEWLNWPGRWGAPGGLGAGDGPHGPGHGGNERKWNDPSDWGDDWSCSAPTP